jgi:hypothetical protein
MRYDLNRRKRKIKDKKITKAQLLLGFFYE